MDKASIYERVKLRLHRAAEQAREQQRLDTTHMIAQLLDEGQVRFVEEEDGSFVLVTLQSITQLH